MITASLSLAHFTLWSYLQIFFLFLFSSLLVYALTLIRVKLIGLRLDQELLAFDLNGDGFFSGSEQTPAQASAMTRVTLDTARQLAPFTAAVFSPIYVALVFGIASAFRAVWLLVQRNRERT